MKTRLQKHTEKAQAFAAIRGEVALRTNIYSFLPLSDRLRLAEVDKEFLADEHRGRIVGVYGHNKDIFGALATVRKYLEFEGTPESLKVDNTPDCWYWVYEMGSFDANWLIGKLQRSFFNKDTGYDLDAIEEIDFGYQNINMDEVIDGFDYVNWYRQENRNILAKLSKDVEKLGPTAPFNALFDLLEKYKVCTYPFLNAEEPPIYGFSEDAFEILGEDGWGSYLQHIRPGRKLTFRNADGKLIEKVLKTCSGCGQIKEGVRDEYCGRKHCGYAENRCRDCTTNRTCSTCKNTLCVCCFDKCCIEGCNNYMCTKTDWDFDDDEWGPGCGFVVLPADMDDEDALLEARERKYCIDHKPEGAVESEGAIL